MIQLIILFLSYQKFYLKWNLFSTSSGFWPWHQYRTRSEVFVVFNKIIIYLTKRINFILLFLKVSTSKFNKISGVSFFLATSNTALIGVYKMSSAERKSAKCLRKCQIDLDCMFVFVARSNSTCYMFNAYGLLQARYQDPNVDMFTKSSLQLRNNGLINYWPIHSDYRVKTLFYLKKIQKYRFLRFLRFFVWLVSFF